MWFKKQNSKTKITAGLQSKNAGTPGVQSPPKPLKDNLESSSSAPSSDVVDDGTKPKGSKPSLKKVRHFDRKSGSSDGNFGKTMVRKDRKSTMQTVLKSPDSSHKENGQFPESQWTQAPAGLTASSSDTTMFSPLIKPKKKKSKKHINATTRNDVISDQVKIEPRKSNEGQDIDKELGHIPHKKVEDEKQIPMEKNKGELARLNAEIERLAPKKWYHGLMPRDEIEGMLNEDGDFLVRTSDVSHVPRFILSISWKGRVRHMIIANNSKNEWYLRNRETFPNIDALLDSLIASKGVLQHDGTILKKAICRPAWYILHDTIKLFKKIGAGSFGDVFLAELQLENKVIDVAAKILKGQLGKKERAAFMKEASINRKFNHPNIVRLLGVAVQMEPMMVILEMAPNGSLKNYVRSKPELTVSQLTCYLYDASKGLAYLAELGVIHRDIAARNCLLAEDYTVKISDFGLSVAQANLKEDKLVKMPIKWLAPETLTRGIFSEKTDVWSYGVMAWEVYNRCKTEPYPGKTNAEARVAIAQFQRMDPPAEAPDYGVQLMKECWLEDPDERITFDKIVRKLKKIIHEEG